MLCRRVSLEELHPALGGGAPETGLDIYCRGRTGLLADDGARWAVLILPGGGYERIAPAEGEPVALAFLAAGIQAFVLSYSVLPALWPRQFLEGAAALAWMRANAPELGFRPDQVAVCGFSAGGHLAGCLAGGYAEPLLNERLGLTPEQVRLISEYADEVILSYDSDEAGQKATLRSLELFRNSPVKVGVLQIPGAKDPDEYIKKYGAERFKALLDGVGNALDFRLGRLRSQYDLSQDAQRLEYVKQAVDLLAERSSPTEQEVYAGRLAEETNISKAAIMTQLGTAVKKAGSKRRREHDRQVLRSGEMDQIKVSYTAGGSQALGIVSAQQRLLAAILREPQYLDLVKDQLTAEQFIQPQQKELYEAMLRCREQGVEISLTALHAFAGEEALNELSHLAAQYSDVNCTPDDIRLYLDRIARGMPVASKAASMTNEELSSYFQSMREKKQGLVCEEE